MNFKKDFRALLNLVPAAALVLIGCAAPLMGEVAYKINGKDITLDQLYKENQGKFFEIEKQKYELIENLSREAYLDSFWKDLAQKSKTSVEKARQDYMDKNTKIKDSEIAESMKKFKDHPRLKELSDAEKKKQITDYLQSVKTREVVDDILAKAVASKNLVIAYPKPSEPLYSVKVKSSDPVKFGPNPSDIKPMGCSGDDCAITVVEYSEFQCPFCERVLPTVRKLMSEYKGKVRWIVRDFPLGFHDRARPAAVAAHCAKDQNKYWHMYEELFKNQRNLADADLKKYAKNVGLDLGKFNKCFDNPVQKLATIEENYRSGESLGVTGTPAFFINGRRLSGALPYEQFKAIFEEELSKGKGKS